MIVKLLRVAADLRTRSVVLGVVLGGWAMFMPAEASSRWIAAVFLFVFGFGGLFVAGKLRPMVGRFASLAASGIYCAVLLTSVLIVEQRPAAEYPAVWLTGLLLPFAPYVVVAPILIVRAVWTQFAPRRAARRREDR